MCYTLLFYISFEICSRMGMRLMSRASIDRKASSIHQVIGRKVQLYKFNVYQDIYNLKNCKFRSYQFDLILI